MRKLTLNLLTSSKIGEVTRQVTASSVHYINTHSYQMKVSFLDNSQKVGTPEFKRDTNLSIRGFLAGPPRSHLIVCFPFQAFQVITRSLKPRAFSLLIFFASSVTAVCGKITFVFCSLSFSDKRLYGSDKIKGHWPKPPGE